VIGKQRQSGQRRRWVLGAAGAKVATTFFIAGVEIKILYIFFTKKIYI